MTMALVVFRRGRKMLRGGLAQSLRLIEENDRTQRTFCQLEECTGAGLLGRTKERWCFPIRGIASTQIFRRGHGPFGQRQERSSYNRRDGALSARVELAHGFDGVAQQFDAHRTRRFGRKDINDAPANGELARQLHHFRARVADGTEVRDEFFVGNFLIFCQRAREIEIGGRILITPQRRGDGRNHQGDFAVHKTKEGSSAAFENISVGTLRFPGKPVKRGERGHATHSSREDPGKETERIGQGFGAAIRIGHEKSGAAQFVRQARRNKSFGDVVQTGDRNMAAACTQSGQGALHRRMAEQSLQSFADGRKYHARMIRIPRVARAPLPGFSAESRSSNSPAREEGRRPARLQLPLLRGPQSDRQANRRL